MFQSPLHVIILKYCPLCTSVVVFSLIVKIQLVKDCLFSDPMSEKPNVVKVVLSRASTSSSKPRRSFRRYMGVRVVKIVLSNESSTSEKVAKDTSTLKLGLWNIRSVTETDKLDSVRSIFSDSELDIMALVETQAPLGICETNGPTTWYNSGPQNASSSNSGVGFLVKHANVNVVEFKALNNRISVLRIMYANQKLSLVSCVAPSETSAREEIAYFYKSLSSTVCRVRHQHGKYLVLGSFNCCIGEDLYPLFNGIIGESLDHVKDPKLNGCRLLTLCESLGLEVSNTYFKKTDGERHSWKDASGHGATTDFVLEPRGIRRRVNDIFVRWQPEVETDHALVMISYDISKKATKSKETEVLVRTPKVKLNVDAADVLNEVKDANLYLSPPLGVGGLGMYKKFTDEYVHRVTSEAQAICETYFAQKRTAEGETS